MIVVILCALVFQCGADGCKPDFRQAKYELAMVPSTTMQPVQMQVAVQKPVTEMQTLTRTVTKMVPVTEEITETVPVTRYETVMETRTVCQATTTYAQECQKVGCAKRLHRRMRARRAWRRSNQVTHY